jgi:hypothetical protein
MTTKNQLPRATPEAQGLSSSALLTFMEQVEEKIGDLHSFMLLRYGQVVAEGWWAPHGPAELHMLFYKG